MQKELVYSNSGISKFKTLKIGEELLIKLLDGEKLKGIFFEFKENYLYTLAKYWIFMALPIDSIFQVERI